MNHTGCKMVKIMERQVGGLGKIKTKSSVFYQV